MIKPLNFLFIVVLFFLNTNVFPQKVLTLDDAMQTALNKNTNVVTSSNSIATFQSSLKSAYGNLLPNLSVGGGFNWQRVTNTQGSVTLDTLGRVISIGSSENDYRTRSLSAGDGVILFDGLANYAAINQSSNNLESA